MTFMDITSQILHQLLLMLLMHHQKRFGTELNILLLSHILYCVVSIWGLPNRCHLDITVSYTVALFCLTRARFWNCIGNLIHFHLLFMFCKGRIKQSKKKKSNEKYHSLNLSVYLFRIHLNGVLNHMLKKRTNKVAIPVLLHPLR